MSLDPRTPVIVGVGQSSERLGEPGYRRRSPVDLAADAAREAILDTGADAGADSGGNPETTRNCSACSPPKNRLAAEFTRGRSEQETKSRPARSG
jgi:hypothetical protein